ncbi:MAG: RNA-binding protein [candidate division Zixibacteria bacterium]|nr:RNA-binding protein [candidate division Zixibacteria bacterium]
MQSSNLYVGNLTYSVSNDQLEELFGNYGEVKRVNIIGDKGFGFVEMGTTEEAEKAMEALNGTDFEGRTIKIDEARPRQDKPRRDNYRNRY